MNAFLFSPAAVLRYLIITVLLSLFVVSPLRAQDLILTMSGVDIPCQIVSDTSLKIHFNLEKRPGKFRPKAIHRSEVFSITRSGQEEILYVKDTVFGNDLSVQEMRIFIAGEKDGRNNYNPLPTLLVGAAMAGTAAYFSEGAFMGTLAVPLVYPLFHIFPTIKIREKTITNPDHRYNEIYAAGYEGVARSRKIFAAFKGVLIGAASGYLMYRITSG